MGNEIYNICSSTTKDEIILSVRYILIKKFNQKENDPIENKNQVDYNAKNSQPIEIKTPQEQVSTHEHQTFEDTITYPDGTIYSGQIRNGLRNGQGIYKNQLDVIIYQGYWKDDMPHGEGKLLIDANLLYIGEFVDGIKSGKGKITSSDEQKIFYSGKFLNGEKHEFGEEKYPDNSFYVGQYFQGKRQGKGKYILENQSYYEGEFADDKIQGKGIFIWSNEKYYDGEWRDNSITGFGIFKNLGSKYIGYFYNDKKNGYGMNIYDNNLYCIGKWVEDELDGLAILIENSKEKMIIFKKGKEKSKITDPLKIKITKTENEFKNLNIFIENMKVKGLY